jgi:threonine dehydratase
MSGHFIHPVSDLDVMAGNATIGAEIVEDLPEVETVLIPFGGGGLTAGIASALTYLRPAAKVVACEVETAAPLRAAMAAGFPQPIEYQPSFVDGIGAGATLPEMWPIVRRLISGVAVVSLEETADAIRTLVERVHVVAEGAGAVPVAAALAGQGGDGTVCCIVSGGNLDPSRLAAILTRAPGSTAAAPKPA